MKSLSPKGAPSPAPHAHSLPPGTGLVVAGGLSVMIWGLVAAIVLLR